jgi:hypothetical protein
MPELATKEHSRSRRGLGAPRRSQKKTQQASIYAFFAFFCGKGLFLAGMREFRAVARLFFIF